MYFSKNVYAVYTVQWGLGQSPRSLGIFVNFCVQSNLKVLLTASYRKKREHDVLVALQ